MSSPTEAIIHANERASRDKTLFGFWLYIMTDCVLFASLFATYAVLHKSTYGGLGAADLFSPSFVLTETLLLLTSSFICGMAMLAVHQRRKTLTMALFGATFLLGAAFLGMEFGEFSHLVSEGNSWARSGFLSGFFTLVGTHGLHISVGLLWIAAMLVKLARRGFTEANVRRLTMLSLFWHFLDVVWIFIFTIVYMMGVM